MTTHRHGDDYACTVCGTTDDGLTETDRKALFYAELEVIIERVGWACTGVFATEPQRPSWVYTVGLADQGHPELLICMRDMETGQGLLNRVAEACRAGDQPWPEHGQSLDWIIGPDFPVHVVAVPLAEALDGDWFNVVKGRRPGPIFALQLVWPDNTGAYPDGTWPDQPVLGQRFWEHACWNCGRVNNAVTATNTTGSPKAGDVSVCFACAAVAIFTGQGHRPGSPPRPSASSYWLTARSTPWSAASCCTGPRREPLGHVAEARGLRQAARHPQGLPEARRPRAGPGAGGSAAHPRASRPAPLGSRAAVAMSLEARLRLRGQIRSARALALIAAVVMVAAAVIDRPVASVLAGALAFLQLRAAAEGRQRLDA